MDKILRVTHGDEIRDFDASRWNYFWAKRDNGVTILRLEENRCLDLDGPDPGLKGSFAWVEYGPPAQIELILFDE